MRCRHAKAPCRLGHTDPVRGCLAACQAITDRIGEDDPPWGARRELFPNQNAVAKPVMHGTHGHAQLLRRLLGIERSWRGSVTMSLVHTGILFLPRSDLIAAFVNAMPRPERRPCLFRMRAICASSNSTASWRTRSTVSSGVRRAQPAGPRTSSRLVVAPPFHTTRIV